RSLVGSEMCIRDSATTAACRATAEPGAGLPADVSADTHQAARDQRHPNAVQRGAAAETHPLTRRLLLR
ncbi:hypothetical protein, partial [Mycobacterium sp. 852013-50091_SCH5140682]|uniref:hypothetical protein n=1 Tax=Mycobacterium sp. 852013-50091_SCH5140682 TaxID=1834109 RepID=UPI001E354DAC